MKTLVVKLLLIIGISSFVTGCYDTTAATEIDQLIEDGYTITWTKQKGEYWDEFTAKNGKRSETFVVNRTKVERSSDLNPGDRNSVKLGEDGKLHVSQLD